MVAVEGSVARVPQLRARRAREDAHPGIRRGHPREPRVVVHGLGRADAERGPKRVGEEARVAETRCFVGRVGGWGRRRGPRGCRRRGRCCPRRRTSGGTRRRGSNERPSKSCRGGRSRGEGPGGARAAGAERELGGQRQARGRRARSRGGDVQRAERHDVDRVARGSSGPARTPGTPTRASRAPSPGPRRRRGVAESGASRAP